MSSIPNWLEAAYAEQLLLEEMSEILLNNSNSSSSGITPSIGISVDARRADSEQQLAGHVSEMSLNNSGVDDTPAPHSPRIHTNNLPSAFAPDADVPCVSFADTPGQRKPYRCSNCGKRYFNPAPRDLHQGMCNKTIIAPESQDKEGFPERNFSSGGGDADADSNKDNSASNSAGVVNKEDTDDVVTPADKSELQKLFRYRLPNTEAILEVKYRNSNSTLLSIKPFKDLLKLRPELFRGVRAMGFSAPFRIQKILLPLLLADPPENIIVQSQWGSGKTNAFVLAMLSRVDLTQNVPQVICLSPTYELALQTGEVIKQMGRFCPDIAIQFAVRGVEDPVPRGEKITSHIVIGTPGKMTDWIFRLNFLSLANIKVFCLDEAGFMIATQGYQDSSIKIHRKLPKNCQKVLFSTTYDTEVMRFAEQLIPDATILRLDRTEEILDNIKQYYIDCRNAADKYRAITNIYDVITIGQAVIFCNTKKTASELSSHLIRDGYTVVLLSGELAIEQRLDILNRFRDGKDKILITTNVIFNSGIGIGQVTLVVNYDLPLDVNNQLDLETYFQRIGRPGRTGKTGIAINLIEGSRAKSHLLELERNFGRPIKKLNTEDVAELEEFKK